MRYLNLPELIELHRRLIEDTGGAEGLRDLHGLESAIAQPRASFGGKELYPTLAEKAAAICYSLVLNHPFFDGNKRVGHAAMETFLLLNGSELDATIDEAEQIILKLASGTLKRDQLTHWIWDHITDRPHNPSENGRIE